MSLSEQQKRYITLTGEPVHATRAQVLTHSPVVQAAGLTALFNIASNPYLIPETMLLSALGSAAGFLALTTLSSAHSYLETRFSFGPSYKNLCIDKAPDKNTPPTSPKHLDASKQIRCLHLFTTTSMSLKTVLLASMPFLLMRYPIMGDTQFILTLPAISSFAACGAVHFGSMFNRFNKVAKGDWVISDLPKKKEEAKEQVPVLDLPKLAQN